MNFKKTMFALAIGSAGMVGAMSAHAVDLNTGDVLTINSGNVNAYAQTVTGSFFVMDLNGDSRVQYTEVIALSQGTTGLTIGTAIAGGNYHPGSPVPADADSGAIVDSWLFNGGTGTNYVNNVSGVTGGTVGGLDMSGWGVSWSGVPAIPMGSGSWTPDNSGNPAFAMTNLPTTGFSDGTALFSWDGVYGSSSTLFYTATVPLGDPSNFGGTQYGLMLTGNVIAAAPVPEASTYGMMLAGLGLVGFAVRRRKLMA